MNYADENFYTQSYLCGKEAVITTAFDFYSRKASTVIRTFTGNNIDENENNIPECVRMCCCELAEMLFRYEKLLNGNTTGMTSQHIGDLSVNYESSENLRKSQSDEIRQIIYRWLSGTGLLYRGVY